MSSSNNSDSKSITEGPPVPPRDDLVKTAAQFLKSPNVRNTAAHLKMAFLKKKGLSDAEIELATKQAEESIQNAQLQEIPLSPYVHQSAFNPSHAVAVWPPQTPWTRFRDIANSLTLLGGVAYAVYWLYKKYAVPYLYGRMGRKSLETRISELENTVLECIGEIKASMARSKEELDRLSERKGDSVHKQIEELKVEVTSLKKLLLNRKQFPTATVTGPLSIPAWQRASSPPEDPKDHEEEGNGSGTNGSDSSLEMIKE